MGIPNKVQIEEWGTRCGIAARYHVSAPGDLLEPVARFERGVRRATWPLPTRPDDLEAALL